MAPQLVWLITGTTSGLGRELALEALKRGEQGYRVATGRARSIAKLADLQDKCADILELDVTSPLETLQEAAKKAAAIHGRIDVLVNNAGYILFGAMEENIPQETFDHFNTNIFGTINVTRAFLPYMREKKTGTIVFTGSIVGWQYLRDTPRRNFSIGPSKRVNGRQPGNPLKGVEVVANVVRGEGSAAGKLFPKGLALGTDCYTTAKKATEEAAKRLEEWKEVWFSTNF